MSRTNCNRIAFRLCLAAALFLLSAGPLTRAVHAEPVIDYVATPAGPDTTASATANDGSGASAFALDETYVVREPVKIAAHVHRERTAREAFVARCYRIRFRVYRTLHMYPRPGFDPLLMLAIGLGLVALIVARRMGLMDETEEEQQTA